MNKNYPVSVYLTGREKRMLGRLSKHCKRPQSDHVRWLVEENYKAVFPKPSRRPLTEKAA